MPLHSAYKKALASLGVSEKDLLGLARAGRLRFVLPQSLDRYPPSLVNGLAEEAPGSMILSRSLAAATIAEMRKRVPCLFPPIGIEERHELLSKLHALIPVHQLAGSRELAEGIFAGLRDAWGHFESNVNRRGAKGISVAGISTIIAAAVKAMSGRDLDLEMDHANAYVEWAAALGATVFPVQSEGYSEQRLAEICASAYSGVEDQPVSVSFGAVDVVLAGLLSFTNDAPVEDLSRVFDGSDIDRLRSVVCGISETSLDRDSLDHEISEFNERVRRYEKHSEKQASHDFVTLAGAVLPVVLPGHPATKFVSLGAWVLNQLLVKLPGGRITDWIRGVNAWSRPDVVLVSRLRQSRHRT